MSEFRGILPRQSPPVDMYITLTATATDWPQPVEATAPIQDDEHFEMRLRMLCEGWIRKVVRNRKEARR